MYSFLKPHRLSNSGAGCMMNILYIFKEFLFKVIHFSELSNKAISLRYLLSRLSALKF